MRSVIAVLALVACGGPKRVYEGPKLPRNEVCIVEIDKGMIGDDEKWEARLARFDGIPVRHGRKQIEILPGEHTFDVSWTRSELLGSGRPTWMEIGAGSMAMTFELRGGFRYVLFWIGGDQPLRFRERPLEP
ncbi:MAG: hypothetical protein ACYS0E_22770 [Planctomycetota bacterium]|jgi:hypothetical protein